MAHGKSLELAKIKLHPRFIVIHDKPNRAERRSKQKEIRERPQGQFGRCRNAPEGYDGKGLKVIPRHLRKDT